MSFLRPSATKQTTSSFGTGSLVLNVNTGDTRSFQAALGSGPIKCRYMFRGQGYFEMGRGTFTAPSTLTRDEPIKSSNADALVSIPAGTTDVYLLDYAQFVVDSFSGTSKSLANADASNTWIFTGAVASALTLPAISAALPDFWGFIRNAGTVNLTLTAPGSDVIDETGTQTVVFAAGDSGFVYLDTANTKWRIVRTGNKTTILQNYLTGLALSTAGASATFSVSPGLAADSTNVDTLTLATALSKTTSAWAVGSGNGALDVGSIANITWYYPYAIKRTDTGVVDALVSMAPGTSAPVTMTIASPGVISWTGHGLQVNAPVKFSTTGALPTGLVAGTQYFVKTVVDANSFQVSATQGGVVINTSGSQSGTHTGTSYPVMPASYTEFRRIGALKTNGSAQWVKFFQYGDEFVWDVMTQDATGSFSSGTAVLFTLSTPPGLNCRANIWLQLDAGASNEAIVLTSPDVTDTAISGSMKSFTVGATAVRQGGQIQLMTSTSAQIRAKAQVGAAAYNFNTIGWFDTRGK